jgi:hypothetical protein
VHEWMIMNPIKSQVIVISRCRLDIPPLTLMIGSDVIKVVPKVNNLGFVLNERLTVTVCQKAYWILHSLRSHASHTTFVYAGADAASQRRLNMAFRGCLRYIHSLRRLDHASHL